MQVSPGKKVSLKIILSKFRQLGFRSGQAVGGSYFGQTVPNKYAMEDVQCTGSEDFLRVKCIP